MCDGLPTLHDPDNSRLGLVITICSDTLMRLLILLFGLFGLDLVDFDAVPWVHEVEIYGEGVRDVDFFTSWLLVKDAVLRAGERLECPLEFSVVYFLSAAPLEDTHVTRGLDLRTYQGQRKLVSRDMT